MEAVECDGRTCVWSVKVVLLLLLRPVRGGEDVGSMPALRRKITWRIDE